MKKKLLKEEWLGAALLGYKYDRSGSSKEQKIILNDDDPLINLRDGELVKGKHPALIAKDLFSRSITF